MKTLLLLLSLFISGCGTYHGVDIKRFKTIVIVSYGDERFDDCKDLVDVWTGITHTGDSIFIKEVYRKCTQ